MYTRNIQRLLDRLPGMPLGPGTADAAVADELDDAMLERLFGGAVILQKTPARLCQAGLWLRAGHLERCHAIAQSVGTTDGSMWHALVHRREGDFSNSAYWYRRAGAHGIYPALLAQAGTLAGNDAMLRALALAPGWDPERFVDCCRSALDGACDAEACRRLQEAEWKLLFDWCYVKATTEGDQY